MKDMGRVMGQWKEWKGWVLWDIMDYLAFSFLCCSLKRRWGLLELWWGCNKAANLKGE